MSLRAALFDLDDTLHDKSANLRAFAATQYARAGLQAQGVAAQDWQAEFVALNNLRVDKTEVFARLRHRFDLAPELSKSLLDEFDADSGRTTLPFPGAIELLGSLRRAGIGLAIVTNGREKFQCNKIAGMGISAMVDVVLTSGGFGVKKPDPRIFLAGLQALGVDAEDAVFVGDDFAADIEPALALGMRTVWKSRQHSPKPSLCSDSLGEIHSYVLREHRVLHRSTPQR